MSDDEMLWDDDAQEDYDGDDGDAGEDGGDDEDDEYKFENTYFQAKDMIEDDPKGAIKEFEKIINGGDTAGEWRYKALKRLVKLYYSTNNFDLLFDRYKLLVCTKGMTENELFKGINKCLDIAAGSPNLELVLRMYNLCFDTLKSKSENTLFKTKLKLAKMLLDRNEMAILKKTLEELTQSCMGPDGKPDPKKGSNLIDIYSIEIQLALNTKDRKRTRQIYTQALQVAKENPGILNSRLAIFHFCGGKILMEQREWDQAYSSFQDSFRFFEEAGNQLKIPCLKYILLANMLRLSKIDPFTSPEAANLKNHSEIAPMANLADAYSKKEIMTFEKILRVHKKEILGDPFIETFLQDLMREVRTQVMLEVIKPYTRISLEFLATELRISQREVESLLIDLILDQQIAGRIDQVNQLLYLQNQSDSKAFSALDKWATQTSTMSALLTARV